MTKEEPADPVERYWYREAGRKDITIGDLIMRVKDLEAKLAKNEALLKQCTEQLIDNVKSQLKDNERIKELQSIIYGKVP